MHFQGTGSQLCANHVKSRTFKPTKPLARIVLWLILAARNKEIPRMVNFANAKGYVRPRIAVFCVKISRPLDDFYKITGNCRCPLSLGPIDQKSYGWMDSMLYVLRKLYTTHLYS
jgi:hypothetical protein